jgi:hypothetical protein
MSSFSPRSHQSFHTIFLVLLTALTLSSCVGIGNRQNGGLAAFTSDGCTLFPDGTFKVRDKWCRCCEKHDLAYWQGGSSDEREEADSALRDCVLTQTGNEILAETMYLGVRAVGNAAFPTWYRWGYGWPYGRGYQPLSSVEKADVREWLALYARRHPEGYCAEKDK